MNQDIKKILEELYVLDKGLRKREKELVKAVEQLLAVRPEAKVDKAFAKLLRTQLKNRARELKLESQSSVNIFNFKLMNKLAFAVGGAALALIIAIPLLSGKGGKQLIQPAGEQINFGAGIVETKDLAFGKLSSQDQAQEAYGRGMAADSVATAESAPAPAVLLERGLGGGGGGGSSAMMVLPPQQFEYVYKGEEFELPDSQVAVLRRIKGDSAAADLARRIGNIDFGVLDLGSFTNQKVHNISVAEDKEFGYMVHANLMEGMLNIGQNWQRWPQVDYNDRLSLQDMPADDKIIAIADEFLKQHNISTDQYADPIVRDEWRQAYEQAPDKSNFYVPEMAQVVYPLLVGGQVVYDQGGNESGLMVSVSIRYNRVNNVSGLTSQQYESSQYKAVTDVNKVIEIVEQGGLYPVLYRDESGDLQDVEVGTPRQVLSRFYHFHNGENQELLAPALLFPITNTPEGGYYYRTSIIVPLVEDLLPNQAPMTEPMPVQIMEEAL